MYQVISNQKTNRGTTRGERGVAIITALFAILLLSAIAFGLMYMANTETAINANFRDSQQAYYSARSGIQEVRERMRPGSASTAALTLYPNLPSTVANGATTTGVLYVLNGSVQPWSSASAVKDTEICHENFTGFGAYPGLGTPCSPPNTTYYTATTSGAAPRNLGYTTLDYQWVRVTLKTNAATNDSASPTAAPDNNRNVDQTTSSANLQNFVCLDTAQNVGMNANGTTTQGKEVVAPGGQTCGAYQTAYQVAHPGSFLEPVYLVTSLAVTPSGARRMLQAEVAKVDLPAPPAALTLPGPGGTYTPPSSNGFVVHGNDEADSNNSPHVAGATAGGCAPYDGNKHAVLTTDLTTEANIGASLAINPSRTDHYTGVGATYPDVTGPPTYTTSTLGQLGDPSGLQNTVNVLSQNATQTLGTDGLVSGTYTDAQVSAFGSTNQSVTVVNGDLTVSGNSSGTGILIVTGALNWTGNGSWTGVVLVVGKGVFNYSGGGNGQFSGAVFVANIYSSIDATTHVPTLSTTGLLAPTLNWNGGGGNGIMYDSCAIANAFNFVEYRELSVKELPY